MELPGLMCRDCRRIHAVASLAWRCHCGGLFDLADDEPSGPLAGALPSLWRYQNALPIPLNQRISMDEGMTPLLASLEDDGVWLKADFLMPTGSFKDRGTVVLATLAAALGVERALVDSSGNAGTASAAYFARAGIPITVMVPQATSAGKLAQIEAHGARIERIKGDRTATAAAAGRAAGESGVFYASHVYHPYFIQGVKTYLYEVWEQLGGRLPATLVVPAGNGTLILGCAAGVADLLRRGLIDRAPRLVAVQAASCAPLAAEFGPVDAEQGATIAEGIAIASPPRRAQIVQAIRDLDGTVLTVGDDQIRLARDELARQGLFVEPTAAVCYAAVRHARSTGDTRIGEADVVLPLCGSGLKSPNPSRSH